MVRHIGGVGRNRRHGRGVRDVDGLPNEVDIMSDPHPIVFAFLLFMIPILVAVWYLAIALVVA